MVNDEEVKQYIILRKQLRTIDDKPISASKLAVMTAHASMAWLNNLTLGNLKGKHTSFSLTKEEHDWMIHDYVKVLLEAKNLNIMVKLVDRFNEAGFIEGQDFFCIHDLCRTEFVPDEDEDTCFVAIGFRPMLPSKIKPYVKRLQLYK